ncbi:MAG TPA: FHA domain-containing protein [Promineifilum sp.]|nr:FHA domain-containing protein [Promineifilum sp.]HRQ13156.1 FHA domain-containing protein [Promineifilum sp.]
MRHSVGRLLRSIPALLALVLGVVTIALAQGTNQIGELFITDSNTEGFPSIRLQLFGIDGQGLPIDFATEPLFITHGGFPVEEVVFDGKTPVGTLTVFLIDAAGGATDQIPAIKAAIQQYASPGNMQEQVDYVAVYQIRSGGPQQLLAPTQFHNGVANLFNTTELVPEEGATSLYDSVITMVGEIDGLKPRPDIAASIVLISDGTDPGTSQAQPGDVSARAVAAGVPIHTIHLEDPGLGAGVELGRQYMRDVAGSSRGVAAELADPAGLASIWARIAGLRDHSWVRYNVPEPAGGTIPVEVSLLNNRDTKATTEVIISTAAPNVVLDVPRESRTLTVPDLKKPITLQLSADVSWLDNETREIVAAQLLVNDVQAAEIPPGDLKSFRASIPNFAIGDNRLEVVVVDNQGITSTSAPVIITVAEGERLEVPEALQPGGISFSWTWLLWLVAMAGLAAVGFWLWRSRSKGATGEPKSRRRRRGSRPPVTTAPPQDATDDFDADAGLDFLRSEGYEAPFVMAHLEVVDAQTLMPDELNLGEAEVRIGRSPQQSHIAFRDDITVSRYHAVMRLEGNRYRIYDAGSTSGTYVNGRQVPEYGLQLADGDEIQLGAVRMHYRQL